MRALKLGCGFIVLLYALAISIGVIASLTGAGLFWLARLVTSSDHPDVPLPVVGVAGAALATGLAVALHRLLGRRRARPVVATGVPVALGILLAAATVLTYPAVTGNILEDEATAAVIAAVRPACRGTAVPAAGRLLAAPGAGNHIVVLDQDGADHGWTGSPPGEWAPAVLGDLELVLCIDRDERVTTDEVCDYSGGPDVTRHTASREVRIVEPATATTLATLTVDDDARACAQTENQDLTDLYGSVEWPAVEAAVDGWLSAKGARSATGDR